jgi:hypothetical protein
MADKKKGHHLENLHLFLPQIEVYAPARQNIRPGGSTFTPPSGTSMVIGLGSRNDQTTTCLCAQMVRSTWQQLGDGIGLVVRASFSRY